MFEILEKHYLKITIFILLSIFILSLTPLDELPKFPGSDKTHHFISYGLLAFPIAFKRPKYWQFYILFFLVCSGVIELIQPFVNRYGEWLDMLANTGGLIIGSILAIIIKQILVQKFK